MASTNERGFTLIEVLIAMVIMTIALVAMAELMAITLRIQMLGRNETAAVRLVQSKIDQLVAVDFTDAIVAVGGSLTSNVTNYSDTDTPGYTRRWQIAAMAGETRVRTLTVAVIPDVKDNRTTRPVQLTTIIRDP